MKAYKQSKEVLVCQVRTLRKVRTFDMAKDSIAYQLLYSLLSYLTRCQSNSCLARAPLPQDGSADDDWPLDATHEVSSG